MNLGVIKELETLGLSQSEAKVYLAGLKLGPATAQQVAAKALTSRPTAYGMIESLMEKGLMSSYFQGKKKLFAAADPRQLTYIVAHLKREAVEKEAAANKIVDALRKEVADEKSATNIQVLEGVEGIAQMQQDVLDSGAKECFELVNLDEARKWIPPMSKGDIRQKITTKLKTHSIYSSSNGKVTDRNRPEGSKAESRYLDPKKFPIIGGVFAYGDRVYLSSYSPKKVGIIIRDAGLAQTLKTMYKALWDKAEKE